MTEPSPFQRLMDAQQAIAWLRHFRVSLTLERRCASLRCNCFRVDIFNAPLPSIPAARQAMTHMDPVILTLQKEIGAILRAELN